MTCHQMYSSRETHFAPSKLFTQWLIQTSAYRFKEEKDAVCIRNYIPYVVY